MESSVDVSHHDSEVGELRADPILAAEYLKVALDALHHQDERNAGFLAILTYAEAIGPLTLSMIIQPDLQSL